MKKTFARTLSVLSAFLILTVIFSITSRGSAPVHAQTSTTGLTGYAWSDNVGWISFSGTNPTYNVTEDSSGNLTGYAWSDNVGWIKFGGLSGFPSGSGTSNENAVIGTDGTLHGWARACAGTIKSGDSVTNPTQVGDCSTMTSRTDGWDGWISLDGASYNVQFGTGNGQYGQPAYVWGSDVVGWINFNPSNLTTGSNPTCNSSEEVCSNGQNLNPSVGLFINNTTSATVTEGTPATLSWSNQNITTCSGSSSGTSGLGNDSTWSPSSSGFATSSGSQSTYTFNATGTETYTLSCIANSQTGPLAGTSIVATPSVTLTIVAPNNNNPVNNPSTCPAVANATQCPSTSGSASDVVTSCPSSDANECDWTCSSGYHMVDNQCVGNGTLQEQ